MENAYNILIKLWKLDRKLHIFSYWRMGRLQFVRATSKFWKLLAQLASRDFRQSFTHAFGEMYN